MTLLLALACASDPNAPPVVHYDLDACADCGMLVSDPAYASAIVTKDGKTLAFDDPGCLFHYMVTKLPDVRGMWFHDGAADHWLRESEVGFVPGSTSPMGSGLKPAPVATPGALSVGEASSQVLSGKPVSK
ncbi:hypothetical protein LBMAG42_08810 [Deltaproteobacteria bacterium]|nr:hypothetical protein LBMAG42_08810 [Deltaproteobacteria bacterium]